MTSGSLVDEVCSVIASARCSDQAAAVKNWDSVEGDRLIIECLLVHTTCGPTCSRAVVVESWSLERRPRSPSEQALPSVFLLNAIRSHLHFSQLSAFLSDNPLPATVSCAFRISFGSRPQLEKGDLHEFPLCSLHNNQLLSVSVVYLQSALICLPNGFCLPLGFANDQWLLPSPTDTPDNSFGAQDFGDQINRLKHKLAPDSPAVDEPKNKVPTTEENVASRNTILPRVAEEKSVDRLTNALNTLVARGRKRTKSSGCPFPFNRATGLPSHSSPAPLSRQRNSFSTGDVADLRRVHGLLGSFEESALKDRLEAVKQVDGYKLQITASGSFSSPHTSLPVKVNVFDENEHDPLPCLGTCGLTSVGRKGYRIPRKGVLQATLFNPQGTVVKVFLVSYDVSDMPPSSHTFLRQRYFLEADRDKHLQHLVHFRLASDRSNRVFLHTDIRVLFSQNSSLSGLNVQIKDNVGVDCGKYQLMSEVQTPVCPKYSPKK